LHFAATSLSLLQQLRKVDSEIFFYMADVNIFFVAELKKINILADKYFNRVF